MSVAVEGFYKPEVVTDPFPLSLETLVTTGFYEYQNQTLVFFNGSRLTGYNNPVNIVNGAGGYGMHDKFRKVDVSITINPTKD